MQQTNSLLQIKRRYSEIPLFIVLLLISLVFWAILAVAVIAASAISILTVYVVIIALFFIFAHAAIIAHIRGNGVRVGKKQFPQLYDTVEKLSFAFGLKKVPEIYIVQSGGVLNAMATKFARSRMVVLYSSLLEACENNEAARNMIIGHELAHIRLGHLNWHIFILPGRLIPFLGKAYSRACEYTCDRYGLAAAGNKEDALFGLILLAVGKNLAPQVARDIMVTQLYSLNTGWMKIGEWLSTHPLLIKRMCALDPTLEKDIKIFSWWGAIRGIFIILIIPVLFLWYFMGLIDFLESIKNKLHSQAQVPTELTK